MPINEWYEYDDYVGYDGGYNHRRRRSEEVQFFRPDGSWEGKDVGWCLDNGFEEIGEGIWPEGNDEYSIDSDMITRSSHKNEVEKNTDVKPKSESAKSSSVPSRRVGTNKNMASHDLKGAPQGQ